MLTNTQAARFGLLVNYAMDMYLADRASLTPKPDPRLAPDWTIVGYLTAKDSLKFGPTAFGATVCYGFLARSVSQPTQFVAVVRGTDGILEWIEDAEFSLTPHPIAGKVERGFFGIYQSLQYRTVTVAAAAAPVIAAVVGAGSLTVIGHSLGSALATYLGFDLAAYMGPRVSMCLFASPRPGDAAFAQAFDQRVQNYQLWNYELDAVPRVPCGLGFADLPKVTWIGMGSAQARIKWTLGCHHHVLSYCSMLDYALADWLKLPAVDSQYAVCIRGPAAA